MNIRFFLLCLSIFLGIIFLLFSWSAYTYYTAIHSDDPIDPLVFIDMGNGKIIRGDMAILLDVGETYPIATDDIIETEIQSKATITWPDKSITRIGPETRIIIESMEVSDDYSSIEIGYEMERGKVWNKVIRTIIGDSYFEVNLPKENIIAGVRGTTFEINLEGGYIQSVDHMLSLTDGLGRSILLLPGEIVSSTDILVKLGREYLDATWNDWNTVSDSLYEKIRSEEIEKRLGLLGESMKENLSFTTLSRELLQYVPGFESLEISQALLAGKITTLSLYSEATLTEYYQKLSGISLPDIEENLRTSIITKIQGNERFASLRKSLQNASIWDSIESGKILPEAERIFEETNSRIIESIRQTSSSLSKEAFFEAFSGSLKTILGN